jgi:hypothetical protein
MCETPGTRLPFLIVQMSSDCAVSGFMPVAGEISGSEGAKSHQLEKCELPLLFSHRFCGLLAVENCSVFIRNFNQPQVRPICYICYVQD